MKKVLVVAMLMLLPTMAMAEMPLTIGAMSAGYGATGMNKGSHFTNVWVGLRTLKLSPYTAVYATYQNVGQNGGVTGNGAKVMLVSGSEGIPWLKLIVDIGVASNLALQADGTTTAAFTVGGGAAFKVTEYIAPFVYASAYDAGEEFSKSFHFGMTVLRLEEILAKIKGK